MSIDFIYNKFSSTVDAPAYSLPRHNIPSQLPDELPADLLRAPLVWVRRRGAVPLLQRTSDGPYAVIARGPRAFPIRVGTRDEIISVARLKPCTDAAAKPGSP